MGDDRVLVDVIQRATPLEQGVRPFLLFLMTPILYIAYICRDNFDESFPLLIP